MSKKYYVKFRSYFVKAYDNDTGESYEMIIFLTGPDRGYDADRAATAFAVNTIMLRISVFYFLKSLNELELEEIVLQDDISAINEERLSRNKARDY